MAATWFGTLTAIQAQHEEATARVVVRVTNQASSFEELVQRQILDLDQTLRFLAGAWEVDPRKFDLAAWRDRAVALSGIGRELLLADASGHIVQSTVADSVGIDVSDRDYFAYAQQHGKMPKNDPADPQDDADVAYLGAPTDNVILRRWHMEMARALRYADGSFGGAVIAEWRDSAIDNLFRTADLGPAPLVELVGLDDGKLRALVGPATGGPGDSIADSQMFVMLRASPNGTWIGRSSLGGVARVHAFRRIPGRQLAVVVGIGLDEAMAPFQAWEQEAKLFAGCITC